MRKVLLFAIMIILIMSCSKEEDTPLPPVVIELEPTIELSIMPEGVIPFGGEVTLTIKTTNAKKVFVNNEEFLPINGTKKFIKLIANTEIIVTATNVIKTSTKKITANVGDWTTSKIGRLLHNGKSWEEKEGIYVVNGIVVGTISASNKYKYIFYIDGTFKVYDENNTFLSSDKWTFVDNETKLVFGDPNIFPAYPMPVLSTTELWLDQNTIWLGQAAIVHTVYH